MNARSRLTLALLATMLMAVVLTVATRVSFTAGTASEGPGKAAVSPGSRAETGDDAPLATVSNKPERTRHTTLNSVLVLVALAVVLFLARGALPIPPDDSVPDRVAPPEPLAGGGGRADERGATAEAVAAVEAAVGRLREVDDPRLAVRCAYAELAIGLVRHDLRRDKAETEGEYLLRLSRLGGAGPGEDLAAPLARLTVLFAQARFSESPIDEDMRQAALDSLNRLRRVLAS